MLVLVRLLTPADYGTAALAQTVLGLASIVSFNTFSAHILQQRDPTEIDWNAHFAFAARINLALFVLTALVAAALFRSDDLRQISFPLAFLALTFLVEIPATLRHRMLESQHSWLRYRTLLLVGTALGLGVGLFLGYLGAGVWALVVQPVLFGVPAAIDLLVFQRFRPSWRWDLTRYEKTLAFGANRLTAAAAARGRVAFEQFRLSGAFDIAALGVFTRANGLATLAAGRVGSIMMSALYPIVTRAEAGSARFQRLAGLTLAGVVWITAPAVVSASVTPQELVHLLYGPRWNAVGDLLRLATISVALAGVLSVVLSLLLANNNLRAALRLELLTAAAVVIVALVVIPKGLSVYLGALCLVQAGMLVLGLFELKRANGISFGYLALTFIPSLASAGLAAMAATTAANYISEYAPTGRLLLCVMVAVVSYILVLRLVFPRQLGEILEVAPGGRRIGRCLGIHVTNL
jgi:teichuronic acid exporter